MRATAAFVAALSISALLASDAAAATPLETVRQHVSNAMTLILDPDVARDTDARRRSARIQEIVAELFDFADMARRVLGPHWAGCSSTERVELARLVQEVLERSYIRTLENYAGERIVYDGEHVNGPYATVKSRIVARPGFEISVDYRLCAARPTSWKVFDVAFEGCSVIANYRAQFDRIIHKESVARLMERLRQKDVELIALRPRLGEDRARGPALLLAPFLSRRRY
jgi:phospholipid transport system substrate-binding protein